MHDRSKNCRQIILTNSDQEFYLIGVGPLYFYGVFVVISQRGWKMASSDGGDKISAASTLSVGQSATREFLLLLQDSKATRRKRVMTLLLVMCLPMVILILQASGLGNKQNLLLFLNPKCMTVKEIKKMFFELPAFPLWKMKYGRNRWKMWEFLFEIKLLTQSHAKKFLTIR